VVTAIATDADLPAQTLVWSIAGGADASLFAIDPATGQLHFVAAPDYEQALDANADNVYDVSVQASDGNLTAVRAYVVSVQPVDDNAPVITSDGGAAVANVAVAENSVRVTTVTGADADLPSQTLVYTIAGGADAAAFRIDAATGQLDFLAAPDHEHPADANGDGRYVVQVSVSDGVRSARQTLNIDVANVNEPPTVTAHSMVIADGGVTFVLLATDVDTPASSLVYGVVSTGGGRFERVDARGSAITSFTQADVDAGRIIFAADGSGNDPVYTLQLTDGASVVGVPAPTVRREASLAPAVKASTSEPPPATATPARPPAPQPAFAASSALLVDPPVVKLGSGDGAAAADASAEVVRGPQFGRLFATIDTRAARVGADDAGYAFNFRPSLPSEDLPSLVFNSGLGGDLLNSSVGRAFTEQLDRMREELAGDQGEQLIAVGSAGALATSLSAGYVLWLARGGVLLASLMSSVPAWAGLDPLPVLAQMGGRRGDDDREGVDDTDPIERLFSRARRLVNRSSPDAAPADDPTSTAKATAPAVAAPMESAA
jgi:hypothetical protein